MAQLQYTTQDGNMASIELPADAGFTARIIRIAPPPTDVDQVRANIADLDIPERERVHEHYVLGLPDNYLVLIIQPRKAGDDLRAEEVGMLIHRSRREWLIVAEGPARIRVDGQPIPLLKIAKDGMRVLLADLELTFREVSRQLVDADLEASLRSRRCPFCADGFMLGDEILQCPSCGTVHHTECWQDYGNRCSGPTGCRYGMKASGMVRTRATTA
jgi:hypothetical protein